MGRPDPDHNRIDRASRLANAPANAVYHALTYAADLAAWLPPAGMTGKIHAFEPVPGGRISLTLTYDSPEAGTPGKTSDDTDTVEGRFVDLVENERIVWDIDFVSDDPAFAGTMRMTWTFTPHAEGTMVTVAAENVPRGISPADHAAGLASSLENLAAHVQGSRGAGHGGR